MLIERPAHAYDLAGRLGERCGQLTVTRSTVATLLKSLARAGLVSARSPGRVGNRPPRTVYEATEAGVASFHEKVEAGLRDSPAASVDFVLAVGHVEALAVERAVAILEERARRLTATPGEAPGGGVLAAGYWRDIVAAEVAWITGLVEHLRSGGEAAA